MRPRRGSWPSACAADRSVERKSRLRQPQALSEEHFHAAPDSVHWVLPLPASLSGGLPVARLRPC
ncbi:hypothetical protein [Altererythrobacter lauratis]|uniref:Uncharacterized protein n=1 Tax=Alteraurantiacibacter lauratis TaxID=2054627 RepID=A0ABV7EGB9_9SPHN